MQIINNKKAFSLIISLFLMLLTSLLALFLLEYIIPFSKNTKGMENGTKAYYEANKGIEDTLFIMKEKDVYFETGKTIPTTSSGYSYTLISTGVTIPILGNGVSEYSTGAYNIIGMGNPVQLLFKGPIDWNNVVFYFRVPHFDDSSTTDINFASGTNPIINWQLSSNNGTLNSSGSYINNSDIKPSNSTSSSINGIGNRIGFLLSGSTETFQNFYNTCEYLSGCILKLSVINELLTDNNKKIPYLEYNINFSNDGVYVPGYFSKIIVSGKSFGYRKDIELDIPQQTTNEAFDFTVFQ